MPERVPTLYSLGVAPFFGFLSNLLDTIGLPAKHILSHCLLLHNQPSLDQQLFFLANYEHFHFLSVICILSMDRPVVGLRLPKLPILIAALWIVTPSRQLQTFVLAMSEERIIPMQFSLVSFVPLFFLLTLVFLIF